MSQESIKNVPEEQSISREEYQRLTSVIDSIAFTSAISINEISSLSGLSCEEVRADLNHPLIKPQLIEVTQQADQGSLYRLKQLSEMNTLESKIARRNNIDITKRVVSTPQNVSIESLIEETPLEFRYMTYDSLRRLYGNQVLVPELMKVDDVNVIEDADRIFLRYRDVGWSQKIYPVFEANRERLLLRCYKSLRNYQTAEDVLSHVLEQSYTQRFSIDLDSNIRAWLYTVALHKVTDYSRQRKDILISELETNAGEEDFCFLDTVQTAEVPVDRIFEHVESVELLLESIDALTPKFRAVVYLRYIGDLTFKEIGLALRMPENTAKTYFQRARPLMEAYLEEHGVTKENYKQYYS